MRSPESLKLKNEMDYYYGTEHYYTNPMLRFKYTDGVKAFCEKAGNGAYWMLDIVNSLFFNKKTLEKMKSWFISIKLEVNEDKTASISFNDGDEVFYSQLIPFTDCPDGEWLFYFDNDVLLWNGEY